jgi:hypothetical protein
MSICTLKSLPHLLAVSVALAILLPAGTAQADFFEDLGFAVGKLGDAVTETVDDAFSADKSKSQPQQPAAPAKPVIVPGFYTEPPAQPAQPSRPTVAQPKTTNFNKTARANTAIAQPTQPSMAQQKTANKVDDAPPPKAAPARIPVSVVGAVAPLPGTTVADSTHQPRFPKQQGVAPMTTTKAAAPVPKAKPAAKTAKTAAAVPEGPRSFALRYNGQSAVLSDNVIAEKTSPPEQAKTLIFAAAGQGLTNPKARISLVASSYVVGEDAGAARLRAFERAQQVQRWLVASGLRPTQMDFTIVPAGSAQSGPADKVDILVSSAK